MPRPWNRMLAADDLSVVEQHPDGRTTTGLQIIMCDEDIEATRAGYKCINCYENLDHAFPKECPVCAYPMADRQAETFDRLYAGHVPGARTGADFAGELERMDAEAERRAFRERTGISVVVGKSLKRQFKNPDA